VPHVQEARRRVRVHFEDVVFFPGAFFGPAFFGLALLLFFLFNLEYSRPFPLPLPLLVDLLEVDFF
jgi:hypothetical protein